MATFNSRVLNVYKDPVDPRDQSFSLIRRILRPELPESADWSINAGPVVDQGETGSCVGQACASLLYWRNRQHFSARFLWMTAKEIDPWIPSVCFERAGTRIRDAFKAMRKYGACRDELWPFTSELPLANLEDEIVQDAMRHRIGRFWRLSGETEIKQHLAEVGPFVAGVMVYESWDQIRADGVVPEPSGTALGGHAILIVGYDAFGRLHFKNSWGTEWGDGGYGWLPTDYPLEDAWGTDPD